MNNLRYCIYFIYDGKNGQNMKSTVYTNTLEEAKEVVNKHIADETLPKMNKWRIYQLIEQGTNE